MSRVQSARRRSPSQVPRVASPLPAPTALYLGRLVGNSADGCVLVQLPGNADPLTATVDGVMDPATMARAQREGVPLLLTATTDGLHVVGLLQPLSAPPRQEIIASEQVVLRSGAASLTLTAAGKVLLRGAYVSSWSNGVNRIVGRTVRLD